MPNKGLIIAIDGPAGSGKSTLAKELAKKLGYLYVDTGAMYRAIAWKALQKKINLENKKSLYKLSHDTKIELRAKDQGIQVLVDGRDVSEEIRTPLISNYAPLVAQMKEVRQCMVKHQRKIAEEGGVVLEGRDIGTVVFPDADIKLYIEAKLDERAKRRQKELQEKGIKLSLEKIKQDMKHRDFQDQSRHTSPLRAAQDAIHIDSTQLSIEQKTELAMQYIQKSLKKEHDLSNQ